jgi:hypothetical protein
MELMLAASKASQMVDLLAGSKDVQRVVMWEEWTADSKVLWRAGARA